MNIVEREKGKEKKIEQNFLMEEQKKIRVGHSKTIIVVFFLSYTHVFFLN